MTTALQGVLPVAPTVFHEDETLDLEGQRRVTEFLIDAGSAAVCVLANYSEQFSLTDDERVRVLQATLDQADGRVPVIATTSSYSARIARERSLDAQRRGAQIAMLMAPFFGATMTVAQGAVLDYFPDRRCRARRRHHGAGRPMSPTPLSVELLATLAEIPQVQHAKIEMPRTATKIRALAVQDAAHG